MITDWKRLWYPSFSPIVKLAQSFYCIVSSWKNTHLQIDTAQKFRCFTHIHSHRSKPNINRIKIAQANLNKTSKGEPIALDLEKSRFPSGRHPLNSLIRVKRRKKRRAGDSLSNVRQVREHFYVSFQSSFRISGWPELVSAVD